MMEQLIYFHDYAMLILILTISLVSYASFSLIKNDFTCRYILDGQKIETIWTILPAFVLIFLALPSLQLLYLLDEVGECDVNVKCVGHQWY